MKSSNQKENPVNRHSSHRDNPKKTSWHPGTGLPFLVLTLLFLFSQKTRWTHHEPPPLTGPTTSHNSTPPRVGSLLSSMPVNHEKNASSDAHSKPEPGVAGFNGRKFYAQTGSATRLLSLQQTLAPGASQLVLVGLNRIPDLESRAELSNQGIELLSYVPEHAWVARVSRTLKDAVADKLGIAFVQPFDAALRTQPGLLTNKSDQEEISVYVHLAKNSSGDTLNEDLLNRGGWQSVALAVNEDFHYLAARVPAGQLPNFLSLAAHHPDVQYIERAFGARLMNNRALRTLQSGQFDAGTPFFDEGIYGSNQVIAICDTGIDIDSCYHRDAESGLPPVNDGASTAVDTTLRKVIAVNFLLAADNPDLPEDWDNHGHGTQVAGCAAGSNIEDPLGINAQNGMAPGAQLIIQDAGFTQLDDCSDLEGLGCPVTNFYPALIQTIAQGATIHNNSWGDRENDSVQNIYTEPARELDMATWLNKEFLVVCAAGNARENDTVGSPSIAKNALSVAATGSGSGQEGIAGFSSRGWASDGRLKPDVAAPGSSINTSNSDRDIGTLNCSLRSSSGTSFSSPLVAGMAALVRDYFAQGFYPGGRRIPVQARTDVSAALVKAVLIHGAVAMEQASAAPPSRDQGWGRVSLDRSLPLAEADWNLLATDQILEFSQSPAFPYRTYLKINSDLHPLKVTLVWTDFPATAGADRHLVNDLDLRVRSLTEEYRGNVLADGHSVGGGEFDRINNVEQVRCPFSSQEIVEISVWAHGIPAGPQDFALVATGDFTEVTTDQDTDDDGLADYWEWWHFKNLTRTGAEDPDEDGSSNHDESIAGTHPEDPDSRPFLQVSLQTNGSISLTTAVAEGRRYTPEFTDTDPSGEYQTFNNQNQGQGTYLSGRPGESGEFTFFDDFSPASSGGPTSTGRRYYRLRVENSDPL